MERIQAINPTRIQWCCQEHGITPPELARTLGISDAVFQNMMDGKDGLTFLQLRRLADTFGRGVLFFLEPEPVDEQQMHTPQFRTLTNQKQNLDAKTKMLIERVEKQRAIYLSLREDLGETEDVFTPPDLPKGDPKQAAAIARDWLGIGEKNDFDTYRRAVENRGVLVFRTNGYEGAWQIAKGSPVIGFSLYDPTCPAIVVKKQAHEARQTFTLIHELGHLLLHRDSFIDADADLSSHQSKESAANAFAGRLLVPDSFLANITDAVRPQDPSGYDDWLKPYRKAWGVSTEVILRRLRDNDRLSAAQYGAYHAWVQNLPITDTGGSGTRQYRYREPKHIFGDPFVRVVLDALSARHITLAKASTYLDNLKIKDVHQLEHYVAGI